MGKSFLICPVRGVDPAEHENALVSLGLRGFDVHFPPRDTNQDDSTGLYICRENRSAIEDADIVHVIWDGKSQGCLFDLGMAFALRKTIEVVSLPSSTEGKSFQNMVRAWAAQS